jgi:uncharacterized membrane protein YjdF
MSPTILKKYLLISLLIFAILYFPGKFGPRFMDNARCYTYLGCNAGFLGYDAVEHFVSGVVVTLFVLWFSKKDLRFNFFHASFKKNMIIMVALLSLVAVSWELVELAHDQAAIKILHIDLYHPNRLDQPSNADTLGDITFSIIGGLATMTALKAFHKDQNIF